MSFEIIYAQQVVDDDIPKLSSAVRQQIKRAIETKLTTHPEHFGKPLRRSLAGYRKLRVGDYRVVFRIQGFVVKIFVIQHRSTVYITSSVRLT